MVVTLKFLISHEKSLQVRLDYSEIINHIQMHENKFCLQICLHLKWEKWGRECSALWARWGAHLHNIQFKQARREWFVWSGAEMNRGHVLLSFFIQITFRLEHFMLYSLQAQLVIWQAVFLLELNSGWQILKVISLVVRVKINDIPPKAGRSSPALSHKEKGGHFFVLQCLSQVKYKVQFCATTFGFIQLHRFQPIKRKHIELIECVVSFHSSDSTMFQMLAGLLKEILIKWD